MRPPVAVALSLAISTAGPLLTSADPLTAPSLPAIKHEPLTCMVVADYPRVDAEVTSSLDLKRARVYFKAHQHPDWYYVDMRSVEGAQYLALLPQPLPETRQVDYYLQALDAQVQPTQTMTYTPGVITPGPCQGRSVRPWRWPEAIVLGGTKKRQRPIPPGFKPEGIVAFVTVTGTTIAGAALLKGGGAGMASGGGGSTPWLVVGGVAVAGAATAGVLLATKDDVCPAEPERYFEVQSPCPEICGKARSGCPLGLQKGVGRWPTVAAMESALAGHYGVILVDNQSLPVFYEGATWHEGDGQPGGFGNRARAIWVPTIGTHMLSAYWSYGPENIERCECAVTR